MFFQMETSVFSFCLTRRFNEASVSISLKPVQRIPQVLCEFFTIYLPWSNSLVRILDRKMFHLLCYETFPIAFVSFLAWSCASKILLAMSSTALELGTPPSYVLKISWISSAWTSTFWIDISVPIEASIFIIVQKPILGISGALNLHWTDQ